MRRLCAVRLSKFAEEKKFTFLSPKAFGVDQNPGVMGRGDPAGRIERERQHIAPTVKVNRDKSRVVKSEESSFRGFIFTRKRLTVSEKSLTRFKTELRRLTGRSWGVSMDYRYWKIRTYLHEWINYFGVAMKYNDALERDHWLRRRIRMCYWKQWRRTKKRVGELIGLGAPRHHAILAGLSRKGYWPLSKTTLDELRLG